MAETSLAVETDGWAGEESRLKALLQPGLAASQGPSSWYFSDCSQNYAERRHMKATYQREDWAVAETVVE